MTTSLLDRVPVVPVVVVEELEHAVPVARALARGGLPVVELTLRTPVALDAVRAIAAEVPEVLIGAGTIVEPKQAALAVEAGARFLVSPGSTPALIDAMTDTGVPFLPGVATVSEALAAYDRGLTELKFFPAKAAGGAAYLRSIADPLPQVRFCPTGGVTLATAPDYLGLPNVGCVGGTWLTPSAALTAGDWETVEELARTAAALGAGR